MKVLSRGILCCDAVQCWSGTPAFRRILLPPSSHAGVTTQKTTPCYYLCQKLNWPLSPQKYSFLTTGQENVCILIFRAYIYALFPASFTSSWRWKQKCPPKRWYPIAILQGVTSQNTSTWTKLCVYNMQHRPGLDSRHWHVIFPLSSKFVVCRHRMYYITWPVNEQ
jgi:hypothetical protein